MRSHSNFVYKTLGRCCDESSRGTDYAIGTECSLTIRFSKSRQIIQSYRATAEVCLPGMTFFFFFFFAAEGEGAFAKFYMLSEFLQ